MRLNTRSKLKNKKLILANFGGAFDRVAKQSGHQLFAF